MTIETLRLCRNGTNFDFVWQTASTMALKMKKWLADSPFNVREASAPRRKTSRRLQALVDEYAQGQSCLTPESHHRINTYYTSIYRVLSELKLRFSGNDQDILSALGDICHCDAPDEESFTRVANFYNMDREILEAEQKMYSSFCRARGFIANTVSEVL